MPKRKQPNKTKDIVTRVKSLITDVIVREWLNTPIKEWDNRTPLQIIENGDGDKLLETIKKVSEESPKEREENDRGNEITEDSSSEEEPCQHSIFIWNT